MVHLAQVLLERAKGEAKELDTLGLSFLAQNCEELLQLLVEKGGKRTVCEISFNLIKARSSPLFSHLSDVSL